MKARKVHNGRIFIFSDRSCKEQVTEIRSIISEFDKEFETYINEIKVDQKGQETLPQIFLNSTYFGGLEKLKSARQEDSSLLHEKIRNTLEEQPGRIYQVYKRQSELLQILPSNITIQCVVTLHNLSSAYVAFKLKSTAPKKYNVKPRDGVLGPHATQLIEITLNKDVTVSAEEDKFRVESVRLPTLNPDEISLADVFKNFEKSIVKQKICSIFDNPPSFVQSRTQGDVFILEWPECRWKEHSDFEKLQIKMFMEDEEVVYTSPRVEDKVLEPNKFVSFSQPKEEEKSVVVISPEIKATHVDTQVPKPVPLPKEDQEENVSVPKLNLEEVKPREDPKEIPQETVKEEGAVMENTEKDQSAGGMVENQNQAILEPLPVEKDPPKEENHLEKEPIPPVVKETPKDQEKPLDISPKKEPAPLETKMEQKVQPEPITIKKEITTPHRPSTDRGGSLKTTVSTPKRLSREINPREDELVRIVLERNDLQIQLAKATEEILALKKMATNLQENGKVVGNENEDEKYSLHMLLFVAIIFFLVGYALK